MPPPLYVWNRTADLVLTPNNRAAVPLCLFTCLNRKNTSGGQPPQAPNMLSPSPFATQSATHLDLAGPTRSSMAGVGAYCRAGLAGPL